MSIKDKVVVITGAGGVLCREFAIHCATLGAKVALLNRSEEKNHTVRTRDCFIWRNK